MGKLLSIFRFLRASRSLRVMAVLFLLLTALLVGLLIAIVDTEPNVVDLPPGTVADAARVNQLVTSLSDAYFNADGARSVLLQQEELNAALAVLHRGSEGRVSGRVMMRASGSEWAVTVSLTEHLFINGVVALLPSDHELLIGRVQLGSLSLSGKRVMVLVEGLGDLLLGQQQGRVLMGAIRGTAMDEGALTLMIEPVKALDLSRLWGIMERLNKFQNRAELLADPEVVQVYYAHLYGIAQRAQGRTSVSLSHYMTPLFQLAELRSRVGDPVAENHAALLAMAILLGHERFERLIGRVSDDVGRPSSVDTSHVVLAGRSDLRLHFVISVALRLMSDSGMSFAIGELKELMDAGEGGSGFSFADLAADRAGIRFAVWATRKDQAERVQQLLSQHTEERLYFPSILGLAEGISDQRFEEAYQHVESEAYRAMVETMDRRIDEALLYQR